MNVEYYTGVDERLEVPMILPPTPELVDVEHARVLIADDVADTGHTLALVKEFCTGKVAEVRCAVLYEKPRSVVKCEYVWRRTDLWIEFPWSDKPRSPAPAGWPPSRTPDPRPAGRSVSGSPGQDDPGGVAAARPPHAGARERGRAGEVEAADRRLVAGQLGRSWPRSAASGPPAKLVA